MHLQNKCCKLSRRAVTIINQLNFSKRSSSRGSEEGFFCHSERFQQSESIDGLLAYLLNHTATAQPRGGTNIIVVSPPLMDRYFLSLFLTLEFWTFGVECECHNSTAQVRWGVRSDYQGGYICVP